MNKLGIFVVVFVIVQSLCFSVYFYTQLVTAKKESVSQEQLLNQAITVQGRYQQALDVDYKIINRYSKSISACRSSVSSIIDGDYTSALIHAKDVGETEEDVQPLLEERSRLLGTNAELL